MQKDAAKAIKPNEELAYFSSSPHPEKGVLARTNRTSGFEPVAGIDTALATTQLVREQITATFAVSTAMANNTFSTEQVRSLSPLREVCEMVLEASLFTVGDNVLCLVTKN